MEPAKTAHANPADAGQKRASISGWAIVTLDNTQTAAFDDLGRGKEISRILAETADRVRTHGIGAGWKLRDTNGQPVGRIEIVKEKPAQLFEIACGANGRVRLEFPLSHPAFQDDARRHVQLASCINQAASKIGSLENIQYKKIDLEIDIKDEQENVLGIARINRLPEHMQARLVSMYYNDKHLDFETMGVEIVDEAGNRLWSRQFSWSNFRQGLCDAFDCMYECADYPNRLGNDIDDPLPTRKATLLVYDTKAGWSLGEGSYSRDQIGHCGHQLADACIAAGLIQLNGKKPPVTYSPDSEVVRDVVQHIQSKGLVRDLGADFNF